MGTTNREKSPKRREIESVYPELTWHYGISPNEVIRMPRWLKHVYLDALPRLIAAEQLRAIEAASFPNHDPQVQRKIRDRWMRFMPNAEADDAGGMKIRTREDLAGFAALAGVGVVFESKKGGEEPSPS
jgi:hypothetical protein